MQRQTAAQSDMLGMNHSLHMHLTDDCQRKGGPPLRPIPKTAALSEASRGVSHSVEKIKIMTEKSQLCC